MIFRYRTALINMLETKTFEEQLRLSRNGTVVHHVDQGKKRTVETWMSGDRLCTRHPDGYVVASKTKTGAWANVGLQEVMPEWVT